MSASDAAVGAEDAVVKPRRQPFWRSSTFRRLVRHRSFMIGLVLFAFQDSIVFFYGPTELA